MNQVDTVSTVSCWYKLKWLDVLVHTHRLEAICRVSVPLASTQELTSEEKKELISSISRVGHNVPEKFAEAHAVIAKLSPHLHFAKERQAFLSTDANGRVSVEFVLRFSRKDFDQFLLETGLDAKLLD